MRPVGAAAILATLGLSAWGGIHAMTSTDTPTPSVAQATTSTTVSATSAAPTPIVGVIKPPASPPASSVPAAHPAATPAQPARPHSPTAAASPTTTTTDQRPVTSTTQPQPTSTTTTEAGECSISLDKTSVKVGETITATVTTNRAGHRMVFQWGGRSAHGVTIGADGVYRESTVVQSGDTGHVGAIIDFQDSNAAVRCPPAYYTIAR